MTKLISNKTYFTQDFAQLSDTRKIEEILAQLHRIACYNDVDDSLTFNTIKQELVVFKNAVAE